MEYQCWKNIFSFHQLLVSGHIKQNNACVVCTATDLRSQLLLQIHAASRPALASLFLSVSSPSVQSLQFPLYLALTPQHAPVLNINTSVLTASSEQNICYAHWLEKTSLTKVLGFNPNLHTRFKYCRVFSLRLNIKSNNQSNPIHNLNNSVELKTPIIWNYRPLLLTS